MHRRKSIDRSMPNITLKKIHQEFIPQFDRWNGRLSPRIQAWFLHLFEIPMLWFKGNKLYSKHDQIKGTCREHSVVEFGDWLYLTAEIIFMLTKVELKIVPQETLQRVWKKFEANKASF
ncbi:MAG TPA: hypothetical protein VMW04_00430 [Patescibacteria group bacterium]|nr:hypothetical protein [Patescibacteria group bacterium]